MASTQDDVVVRLRLKDVAKFIADVKSGKLAIDDLEKKISKAGRTAAKESEPTGGGFGKLGKVLGGLKWYALGAVGSLAAAGVGVAKFAISSTASLEQVEIGFTTMLGSASKAKSMVADLQRFAQVTPFELSDVETAAQHLLAFGFAAKTVVPSLTAVGNAVSGLNLGPEGFQRIILALGQMRAMGSVQGGEVLQLEQAGVNVRSYLEKALHLTPKQLASAMRANAISARTAIPIILRGMDQQFKGLMAKESTTLGGIWSNLHDAIQQGLIRITSPYLPAMKKWLQDLVDRMPQIEAFLSRVVTDTIGGIRTTIDIGKRVFAWGKDAASQAADWVKGLVGLIQTAVASGDWSPVGAAIGTAIRDAMTKVGGQVGGAAGNVDWYSVGKTAFSGVVTFALGFVSALLDPTVWWGIIKSHWMDVALILVTALTDGFGGAIGKVGVILSKIPLLGFIGRWLIGLQNGITALRGPIMRLVSRLGEAIGNAFIRVWPELGTNLWYWFTRIGEFFTRDVPGIKDKVLKWVSDLVPRAVEGMFTAIFKVIERLMKPLRSLAKTIWKPISDAFGAVVDWITTRWSSFFGWLGGLPVIGGLFGGGSDSAASNPAPGTASGASTVPGHGMGPVPGHALGGTVTRAHTAWVGERGPELLTLPRGSSVIPLPRVPEFAGRGPIHVHVDLNGREIARAVYDDMDDRMARR